MPKSGSIDRNAPLTWPIVWHKILLEKISYYFITFYNYVLTLNYYLQQKNISLYLFSTY